MNPALSRVARPSDNVLFQEVGGESVLLDLSTETYFGLDPVGTRVWTLLGERGHLQKVFEELLSEFDVEPARLETDLLALVDNLAEAGLLALE